MSAIVFFLSFRLKSVPGTSGGRDRPRRRRAGRRRHHSHQLRLQQSERMGLALRRTNAPFNLLGAVARADHDRPRHRARPGVPVVDASTRSRRGKTPLLALEVINSPKERAAVYAMFAVVVALEAALNFTVPLYIQIVQGRSPLATAIAMMPFNLTVFFAAMLIVRFYGPVDAAADRTLRLHPLHARASCGSPSSCATTGARFPSCFGLVLFGIGQGALGHVAVQCPGHRLAQGARGRRRVVARHHANNLACRGRNRGRRRAPRRLVERGGPDAASPTTQC